MLDTNTKPQTQPTRQPTEADWERFYAYADRVKLRLLLAKGGKA